MNLPRQYDREAEILKALAHPVRLAIIDALAKGSMCVRELTELVGLDVSTVSKHLSVLRHAGLVVSSKTKNQVFYQLRTPCVLNFFTCVTQVQREGQDINR